MNTAEFIKFVRLQANLPDTDEDYTDSDILAVGSNVLKNAQMKNTAGLHEGYNLVDQILVLPAGVSSVRVPARALGDSLVRVETAQVSEWLQTQRVTRVRWRPLALVTIAQANDYTGAVGDEPRWFEHRNTHLFFYPAPVGQTVIRLQYYLRLSTLMLQSAAPNGTVASTITSITPNGSYASAAFSGSIAGLVPGLYDLQREGGSCAVIPNVQVDVVSGQLRLTHEGGLDTLEALVATPVKIMLAGSTYIVPLPEELHEPAAYWTAATIVVNRRDTEKAQGLLDRAKASIDAYRDLVSPRTKSQQPAFVNRNSYLRRRGTIGRRGY